MIQFSYSRVSTFQNCPHQYYLRYIAKLKTLNTPEASDALCLGTAVHTGLEKDVPEAIEQYLSNFPVIDDLQINETMKLENIIPKGKRVIPAGEYEVKIECEEFIGYIDLLVPKGDNHFDIYDFKYSNNVEHYMESAQLHVYKYFYEKLNKGAVIDNLYFVFLPKTMIRQKKTENLYQFRQRLLSELDKMEVIVKKVNYNHEKVEEYAKWVKEIVESSETNVFPKNETRLCQWCPYAGYCLKGETLDITF